MSFFKTPEVERRVQFMCIEAKNIMGACINFVIDAGMVPVITETVTTRGEDEKLHRTSATHREGRAFDLRCKDWPTEVKLDFLSFIEDQYGSYGALSADGYPKIVHHHGEGDSEHMHVQVNKKYYNLARLSGFKLEKRGIENV